MSESEGLFISWVVCSFLSLLFSSVLVSCLDSQDQAHFMLLIDWHTEPRAAIEFASDLFAPSGTRQASTYSIPATRRHATSTTTLVAQECVGDFEPGQGKASSLLGSSLAGTRYVCTCEALEKVAPWKLRLFSHLDVRIGMLNKELNNDMPVLYPNLGIDSDAPWHQVKWKNPSAFF